MFCVILANYRRDLGQSRTGENGETKSRLQLIQGTLDRFDRPFDAIGSLANPMATLEVAKQCANACEALGAKGLATEEQGQPVINVDGLETADGSDSEGSS